MPWTQHGANTGLDIAIPHGDLSNYKVWRTPNRRFAHHQDSHVCVCVCVCAARMHRVQATSPNSISLSEHGDNFHHEVHFITLHAQSTHYWGRDRGKRYTAWISGVLHRHCSTLSIWVSYRHLLKKGYHLLQLFLETVSSGDEIFPILEATLQVRERDRGRVKADSKKRGDEACCKFTVRCTPAIFTHLPESPLHGKHAPTALN